MLFRCISNLPRAFIRNFTATAPSMCKATPAAETAAEPDTIEEAQEVLPNVDGLTNVNLDAASLETMTPLTDETAGERQHQLDNRSGMQSYSFNMVHLVGRVGCDPVIRGSEIRNVVCFSLATNRNDYSADWHNIAALSNNLRDFVKNHVRKGDLVSVTGNLNYRKLSADGLTSRGTMFPQIRAGLTDLNMDIVFHYIGLHRCGFLQSVQCLMEAILRLPGLFIFELMMGHHQQTSGGINDTNLHTVVNSKLSDQLNFNDKWTRYFEFNQFIKSRNMDLVLENVLIGSVLMLGAMFLILPVQKLVSVYLHTASVLLLGAGYYLSFRYVQSEQTESSPTGVILDDFAKLERHGFHLLSQVMLAASVSCLLNLKSPWMRAILTVGAAPIVARLCGLPADKLHLVHNFACCFLMINVCFYFLNSVPNIVCLMKRAESRISQLILTSNRRRNIDNQQQLDDPLEILATIWRWFNLPPLFALFFLVLFVTEYYVQILKSERNSADFSLNYDLILHSLANSCSTPLSVLGFCATIFYFSYFLLLSVKNFLNDLSQNLQNNFDPELIGPAITESAVVLILAMKIGLAAPDKDWRQKSTLICILLFVIISSLLSSIYDMIEPTLSKLSTMPYTKFKKHMKTLVLSFLLIVLPTFMSYKMTSLLDGKMDVWLTIIISSCLLVTVQILGSLTNYFLFIYDAHCRQSNEIWPMMDDFMFYGKCTVSTLEFIVASGVISAFGLHHKSENCWSIFSIVILICHCYANIWIPLKNGWKIFLTRKHAAEEIGAFPSATEDQLNDLQDVCAICYQEFVSEAKITPCRHYFHAYCLKKWLYVQQSCPMCQTPLNAQYDAAASHNNGEPSNNFHDAESIFVFEEETINDLDYESSLSTMNDSETSLADSDD